MVVEWVPAAWGPSLAYSDATLSFQAVEPRMRNGMYQVIPEVFAKGPRRLAGVHLVRNSVRSGATDGRVRAILSVAQGAESG
jgi:hypothetical protein